MKKLKLVLVALLSLFLLAACGSKKSSGDVTADPSSAIRSPKSAPISWLPLISWTLPGLKLPALT